MPSIRLSNGSGYIEVSNSSTGVTSYLLKTSVVIQKHAQGSMMLKQGDYSLYFAHSNVQHPKTANVVELTNILLFWVRESTSSSGTGGGGGGGGGGNVNGLRASSPSQIISAHGARELMTAGAASQKISRNARAPSATVQMSVSAGSTGARIVRQTHEYLAPAHLLSSVTVVAHAALHVSIPNATVAPPKK